MERDPAELAADELIMDPAEREGRSPLLMLAHATRSPTRKLSGCDDGTYPAICDTDDPEFVAVQGPRLTDPRRHVPTSGEVPAHEQVILFPRAMLGSYRGSGL